MSGANNHGRQRRQRAHPLCQPAFPPPGPGAANPFSQLAGAFDRAGWRDRLVLTPVEPPAAERSFGELPPGMSGTEAALEAARAGDRKRLDELELRWLNVWGPRPTVEQLTGAPDDDLGVVADGLYWIGGRTVIEWSVVRVDCSLCFGRLSPHPRCRNRRCDGSGYDDSRDALTFYTDTDLNLVEAS